MYASFKLCLCTSKRNKHICSVLFQGFYEEVSSPLLLEVDLRYPESAVDLLTNNHYSQLFNGSEIVVSGRLRNNDKNNFLVEVFAFGVRNRQRAQQL